MANSPNRITRTLSLQDFLSQAISDGTFNNVLETIKVDTAGAVPATAVPNFGGQLIANLWDDTTKRVIQDYYKGVKLWSVADATERDALGSDDDLAVDDLLFKRDDTTVWVCSGVLGGSSSSWNPIAATGNVAGPGSSTDNAIARFDGISGTVIQNSLVTVSDTGALAGITNITLSGTVDGRDISTDGATLDAHVASISNPHATTLNQVLVADNDTNGVDILISNGDSIVGEDAGSISFDAVTGVIQMTEAEVTGDFTINGKLTVTGLIDPTGLVLDEQASSPFTAPGKGTLWVKNTSPATLWFTDDAGSDAAVATATSFALASVLAFGNRTGGSDLVVDSGDSLTSPNGFGGSAGVAMTVKPGTGDGSGNGGAITVQGGDGGSGGGNGGFATFAGGDGYGTNANGGWAYLRGGNPIGTGTPGKALVVAGDADSGNTQGADVEINAGAGSGTATGGDINITAGSGGISNGNGGGVTIFAGGGSGTGDGGNIQIIGGLAGLNGDGGSVLISGNTNSSSGGVPGGAFVTGGNATVGSNQAGGNAEIKGGTGDGSGNGGEARVISGNGGAGGAAGDILFQSGSGTSLGRAIFDGIGAEFLETAALPGPAVAAGRGRVWVRNDTNASTLMYTDDGNVGRPISKMAPILMTANQAFLQAGLTPAVLAESAGEKPYLEFADAADRYASWLIQLPLNYNSGNLTMRMWYSGSASSTNPVYWRLLIERMVSGEYISNTNTFSSLIGQVAGPANANQMATYDHPITNVALDSPSPGDWVRIVLHRQGGSASDTYAGTAYLVALQLLEP
jgi:hypothetical protein